ncbi:hypothetical protein AB3662_21485 [Sorangium cellulosum]|uniref:hypothetical protein n=1 Tax=Sorangium cellulosum TaxID=56 RepID=UPI003D9A4ED8
MDAVSRSCDPIADIESPGNPGGDLRDVHAPDGHDITVFTCGDVAEELDVVVAEPPLPCEGPCRAGVVEGVHGDSGDRGAGELLDPARDDPGNAVATVLVHLTVGVRQVREG